jgi:predicted phosphodiesterase
MSKNKTRKGLLLPDLHAPYEDKRAWSCFLDVVRRWKPDVFICLGDFGDCAAISAHPKDPKRVLPFREEIKGIRAARRRLEDALDAAGCSQRHMIQGNHDTRISRFVNERAPELVDLVQDWTEAYGLGEDWNVTPYKESLQIGHLRMTHDVGRAGANAARQTLADVGENIAFGHTHRIQVVYGGTVAGRKLVGATLGWLGDPEAIDYRHRDSVRRDSTHGFGAFHMLADGCFWLNAVPIVEGRCVLDGVLYRGSV